MTKILKAVANLAAGAALLATSSAALAGTTLNTAESIRKLDIMLMVTSLRCRMGADDFQPEYRKFSANHLATLNQASNQLKADLQRKHGGKGAVRALDKLSVSMANQYGQGHPWLQCRELKKIASNLAKERNPAQLALAATNLLEVRRSATIAYLD